MRQVELLTMTDWREIDAALRAGSVPGVPAGTDLEEFLWQCRPEARPDIEARNPGRRFEPAAWASQGALLIVGAAPSGEAGVGPGPSAEDWRLVCDAVRESKGPDGKPLAKALESRIFKETWALQDGYGEPGFTPPQGWDWSGIRDSSPAAKRRMVEAVKAALGLVPKAKGFWRGSWRPQQPLGRTAERAVRGDEIRDFLAGGRPYSVTLEASGVEGKSWRWTILDESGRCVSQQGGFGDSSKAKARQRAERAVRDFAAGRRA